MAYTKTEWKTGDVISADRLNNIEAGIANIDTTVTEIGKTVKSIETGMQTIDKTVSANSEAVKELTSAVSSISASVSRISATVAGIPACIKDMELAISELKKKNISKISDLSSGFTNGEADAVVGKIKLPAGKTSVLAKTIALNGSTAAGTSTDLRAAGDIRMTGVATTGSLDKKIANAAWRIDTDDVVVIRDCDLRQTGYNCVEVGLGETKPRSVTIDNCQFGDFSNNAILIFATQDNAVVNVTNCKFGKLSNCIRLSNRTNAKNVTVNLIDCDIEKCDDNKMWSVFLCEDYMKGTGEEIKAANRFAPEKIHINIINTKLQGKLIKQPADMTVMGTKHEDNLCTVHNDNENSTASEHMSGSVAYGDGSRYPTIHVA